MNLQVQQNMNNQTTLQYKWSNQVTYGRPQEAMAQLRSWMIPAEACPGTFVTLKGACGKTTVPDKRKSWTPFYKNNPGILNEIIRFGSLCSYVCQTQLI